MVILAKLRNNPREWLKDMFPILKWLPKYKVSNIPYDFIAGLTVALTLLPISLAYAQMASLRAEYGLYSSFLAQFLYIFMGTSKDAIIGPSAINSMLVGQFNALNPLSPEGDNTYSVILSFTSGIILFLIGVLKLGFIVNLFSIPVVSGFTTAACFTIIASQFKSFFGLKSAPNEAPAMFIRQCKNVYDQWDTHKNWDMYFGIASLIYLLFVEYAQKVILILVKKCRQPSSSIGQRLCSISLEFLRMFIASRNIIVFIPATGIAYYLVSLDPANEKKMSLVGYIKPGFPVPRFPHFALYNTSAGPNETKIIQTPQEVISNLSVALIIQPLMLMMELFAILKALARKNGYRLDPTNELVCIGIGNFLQSFIQAYPVTAATAKSALNDQCRVRSLLSTTVSIVLIIVAIEALTGIFYFVPKAVLAAILIAAAHHLFDYETVIHIYKEYKPDLFMFTVTFLLCLFYDLAYGILIAILLNMVTFLRPIVRMDFCVTKEPLYTGPNGLEYVTVIQLSHGMKYPSADKFIDRMTRIMTSNDQHYVIDCRFVTGIDFSGLQAWRMFLRMVYQKKKHVIFANLMHSVLKQLEAVGLEHFRYVEDIESAIEEHHVVRLKPKTSDNNLVCLSPLSHRISIVSTNTKLRKSCSENAGIVMADDASDKATITLHRKDSNETDGDLKNQEERIMKLLSFQTHFLHDISVDCEYPPNSEALNREQSPDNDQTFQVRGISILAPGRSGAKIGENDVSKVVNPAATNAANEISGVRCRFPPHLTDGIASLKRSCSNDVPRNEVKKTSKRTAATQTGDGIE